MVPNIDFAQSALKFGFAKGKCLADDGLLTARLTLI